jgi:hypothetical protein
MQSAMDTFPKNRTKNTGVGFPCLKFSASAKRHASKHSLFPFGCEVTKKLPLHFAYENAEQR